MSCWSAAAAAAGSVDLFYSMGILFIAIRIHHLELAQDGGNLARIGATQSDQVARYGDIVWTVRELRQVDCFSRLTACLDEKVDEVP